MLGNALAPLLVVITLGNGALAPGVAAAAAAQTHRAAIALGGANSGPLQYSGRTSQGQPISFQVGSGTVTKLQFSIVISCQNRHRYLVRASQFVPIAIRSGHFAATVSSQHPSASATVSGHRQATQVTGTLHVRRYVSREHGDCAGSAHFSLRP